MINCDGKTKLNLCNNPFISSQREKILCGSKVDAASRVRFTFYYAAKRRIYFGCGRRPRCVHPRDLCGPCPFMQLA
jgi:hypothetical protein